MATRYTHTHTQKVTKYAALRQGEISLYLTTRWPKIKENTKKQPAKRRERKTEAVNTLTHSKTRPAWPNLAHIYILYYLCIYNTFLTIYNGRLQLYGKNKSCVCTCIGERNARAAGSEWESEWREQVSATLLVDQKNFTDTKDTYASSM